MNSKLAVWRQSFGLAAIAWVAIGLYATFLLYPVIQSFLTSFTDRNPLRRESSYVGFDNYIALFHDQRLLRSLIFTLIVTVFVAVVANVLGLMIAMLLNRARASYRVMRTLIFIPQVLSGVIVAFIWRSILTQNGLLNVTLQNLGLTDGPISWIGTPTLATFSICVVVSWVTVAFTTVVYTASLQSVPLELYEAARIDGAGAFGRFRNVTLPMIAPGMTICVTLSLITTLKLFDIVVVLTGGGPANSTKSVAYYLIDVAFTGNRFGYASSIAMLLLALTALISYGTSGILRRREERL
ncbi:sugar ABC transporter permease [Kaistia sp. 32K]|uniref:carbohydrate ABC transporter permease n=1 Tax=Kaistia sp. 32K TaxID=2795690 RepID=UPI0019164F25|nr:sugar ABC transporter permease [Kaistia sp. 32K]BCP55191.1 sugar ABC transporter permease [Kaistia sp. 32K]